MGIFSTIKDAIFGHPKAKPAQQPAPQPTAPPQSTAAAPASVAAPPPPPAAKVDIDATLAEMARENGTKLNYQTSIVDLMKLVGMQSSLDERKTLAKEFGYTGALDGSAEMNVWLHARVMHELKSGGTPIAH